jgi:hypothetical protein
MLGAGFAVSLFCTPFARFKIIDYHRCASVKQLCTLQKTVLIGIVNYTTICTLALHFKWPHL